MNIDQASNNHIEDLKERKRKQREENISIFVHFKLQVNQTEFMYKLFKNVRFGSFLF